MLLWVNNNRPIKSKHKIETNSTATLLSIVTFGTIEKLKIPVVDVVKNLYIPKFNEGINLIKPDFDVPVIIVETIKIADEMPVLIVVGLISIEIKIASAT